MTVAAVHWKCGIFMPLFIHGEYADWWIMCNVFLEKIRSLKNKEPWEGARNQSEAGAPRRCMRSIRRGGGGGEAWSGGLSRFTGIALRIWEVSRKHESVDWVAFASMEMTLRWWAAVGSVRSGGGGGEVWNIGGIKEAKDERSTGDSPRKLMAGTKKIFIVGILPDTAGAPYMGHWVCPQHGARVGQLALEDKCNEWRTAAGSETLASII
ncbi:hypothetical protein BD779DRAFT_1477279 [Infundibulicybe gibba]|nr:hypothetical protein BD779DRAFT_1477279 [Infundibulicybe gibba]